MVKNMYNNIEGYSNFGENIYGYIVYQGKICFEIVLFKRICDLVLSKEMIVLSWSFCICKGIRVINLLLWIL